MGEAHRALDADTVVGTCEMDATPHERSNHYTQSASAKCGASWSPLPQPTPPEILSDEEIENEGFDGYDIPPMKPEVVRHMVGIDKDKYAEIKSALDAKDAEIARYREALDAVTKACRELSPSALPEKRHKIILARQEQGAENTMWDRWWKEYPDGQLVAFAYRVYRILYELTGDGWMNTYEEPGEELP